MLDAGTEKMQRLLLMQERLLDGKVLHKADCAGEFHVTAKTVQRDLETLRLFFAERKDGREVIYDPQARGYRLTRCASRTLTSSEVLAVCKILLDSRSMVKEEMFPILDKLVQNCAPAAQLKQVETLIANERFHYIEPHHGQKFIQSLWDLGAAVRQHRTIFTWRPIFRGWTSPASPARRMQAPPSTGSTALWTSASQTHTSR